MYNFFSFFLFSRDSLLILYDVRIVVQEPQSIDYRMNAEGPHKAID